MKRFGQLRSILWMSIGALLFCGVEVSAQLDAQINSQTRSSKPVKNKPINQLSQSEQEQLTRKNNSLDFCRDQYRTVLSRINGNRLEEACRRGVEIAIENEGKERPYEATLSACGQRPGGSEKEVSQGELGACHFGAGRYLPNDARFRTKIRSKAQKGRSR